MQCESVLEEEMAFSVLYKGVNYVTYIVGTNSSLSFFKNLVEKGYAKEFTIQVKIKIFIREFLNRLVGFSIREY